MKQSMTLALGTTKKPLLMVSPEAKKEKPSIVKDLVLASHIHPWAAQDGYGGIVFKIFPYQLKFFDKHIHPVVHGQPSSVR